MSVFFRSTLHSESSDLADNGPAILTCEGSSQVHDLLLLNITSAPMGLETNGQVITKLLERNTNIHHKEGTDVHDVHCHSAGCPHTG